MSIIRSRIASLEAEAEIQRKIADKYAHECGRLRHVGRWLTVRCRRRSGLIQMVAQIHARAEQRFAALSITDLASPAGELLSDLLDELRDAPRAAKGE